MYRIEPPLTAPSSQKSPLYSCLFLADSPYIYSCFNLSTTDTSQRPLSSFPKVAVVEVQLSVYETHQPRDVECGGVGCLGGKINQKMSMSEIT